MNDTDKASVEPSSAAKQVSVTYRDAMGQIVHVLIDGNAEEMNMVSDGTMGAFETISRPTTSQKVDE